MHKLDYRHRSTSNRPLNDGIRLTYLAAGQNMVVGNTIETNPNPSQIPCLAHKILSFIDDNGSVCLIDSVSEYSPKDGPQTK